ncbi:MULTISPECIES: radical SAM protein [unclassified Clostridioides]|uniref:radical SAM protein n=1 Tax=unclassified Clostridioides TaxID=2635829 RepID=UPI001D0C90B6|nr:radical SAM protein [Clostridioides sp. ES-S-0001-02]MCC0640011.1 radical SAM protein [Clostridioides sp. ES-S-0049-03]MCC0653769.1 radical SAM protein [Clostridioides sp. ES-S-0001-03]MCC0655448.1 radical SAM protein [Clostridioides sp. ES-S-0123-01]MCC0670711.1 radical SAM protein [Clostridioides sp. ES-S-0145-01]MCC0674769.1 radical SAM protein [Clostridioides sp. ES-W-0018-02]MCC0679297.1 radical SAM protein [Clostridioides sp. ES-S-0005-03]MCC0696382.1 radical SAM protein [Clostridio
MDRYSEIINKNQREIVLLKSFPCIWGRCSFCDYIDDNSNLEEEMNKVNFEVLKNITGKYGVLEVINSGSCFEIPKDTLERIKKIIKEKNIKKLFLESHWSYKNRLKEMRDYFEIPIIFKIGVETFDYDFRNNFLNKNARFKTPEDVKEYFDSPCIMVGIKGQTKEMIDNDMDIILNTFEKATVNVFINNSSKIKRDEELVKWFINKYEFLNENPNIEVLYNNTDFGVGD